MSSHHNHLRHIVHLDVVPGEHGMSEISLTSRSGVTQDGVEAEIVSRHASVKILFCLPKGVFSV